MQRRKNDFLQYAGLGTQWLIFMGAGVFAGLKTDRWLGWSVPVAVWLFPLIILLISLVRLVRDTGNGK